MTPDQAATAVESLACPACGAPPGRPCRTRAGDTASRYHTPRFVLVPELSGAPEVVVPADRQPGRPWPAAAGTVRIGYACPAPGSADLAGQVAALAEAGCRPVFQEDVGAMVRARPELRRALQLAAQTRQAESGRPVFLAVLGLGQLARDAAELIALGGELRTGGTGLELLAGPLAGRYDPDGGGSLLFDVLAAAAELDRDHRRALTVAGQRAAAARGRPGGRPKVFDPELRAAARALRDEGVSVPEIAARLVISAGKNAGGHPSVASVYRALAAAEAEAAASCGATR